ncbi:hypothetical protein PF007_g27937 [Phytophthora fragariae]|uniref:Retrotransposon gag domain-containing protein n=1 Tax=Phytophthora fragariae TaxID=53985 RepID=A0A6A3QN75_9STRA|nr:hypothetical protein PF007_g27937 [Phytophthora fragariae]KAE9079859.1 hypothetical protein PF006_g27431 [Phytophthora fragariae]
MAQQRASTVSRDERADRRVSQAEVEAAAARAAAAVEAAREVAERALTPAATLMTGTDEDLVAKSANVRVSTGRTPRTGNDGDGDGDDDDGVVMVSMTNPDTGTGGQGDGGQAPAPPATPAAPPTPTVIYRDREREKKLRLPKFKGLDEPKLTVNVWLKAVKNELRRQAAALLWFDTVEDSFLSREDQTFGNLSRLLEDRYMVKRSNPEVVARLRLRRQQRGEPLVEYAQKLREIASSNPVDEEWLVDAFLSGMHNSWSASLVRGHRPATLNAAVNAALDQVREYGEGYGVGLSMAIATKDRRAASTGTVPTVAQDLGNVQFGGGGNLGSVVSGYGDFSLAAGPPPRYDMEGRLVVSKGSSEQQATGPWDLVIPTGYQLVPQPVHGQHADSGKTVRRTGKTQKMEGYGGQGPRGSGYNTREPLRTREERLRNHQRYEEAGAQRRTAASSSKDNVLCYYCHQMGHYAAEYELKRADMQLWWIRTAVGATRARRFGKRAAGRRKRRGQHRTRHDGERHVRQEREPTSGVGRSEERNGRGRGREVVLSREEHAGLDGAEDDDGLQAGDGAAEAPGSNVNRQRDEKRRVRFVDERDGKTEDAAPAVTTEAAYASTSDVVMANDGTDECETTDPAATTVGAEVSSMAPGEDTVHGDDGRGPWTAARWLLRCSAKKSSEW